MNKQTQEALKMAIDTLDEFELHQDIGEYDLYRIDKYIDLDKVRNACKEALDTKQVCENAAPAKELEAWISVKDKVPVHMDYYLLFMKGNEHCADMITKGIYSKSHWGFITEYGGKFFMPVTHWMSLPKAPIEKAHGIGVSK